MVMVDRLVEASAERTVVALRVHDDNIFCENGLFREPGLIENMAQAAAAGAGALPGAAESPPRVGFIGGIRNLRIAQFPRAGQEIITHVTVLHDVFDARIVQGQVFLEDVEIASCELKIFYLSR